VAYLLRSSRLKLVWVFSVIKENELFNRHEIIWRFTQDSYIHIQAEKPANQIIIGSFPLGVVKRGVVVIPLWYIGLFGVPHAVRCTIRGSLDEDS
jgi:hypothetical protein